jgi:hypothetical protein
MATYVTPAVSNGLMPENTQAGEQLAYDVEAAGRKIGMGRTWMWNAIRSGLVPSIQIGKRVLVTRAALEAYVASLEEGE